MSNYSYVVSRSNVSILLTTLSNRTNPLFVANIKDENLTRHTSAITIVNNWHTSIAHSYGRVRHNAARAASFLKPPSRRREEDCIVRSMTYEWLLICLCRIMQLVKSNKRAIRSKHTRLQLVLSSPEGSNLLTPQNRPTAQLATPQKKLSKNTHQPP